MELGTSQVITLSYRGLAPMQLAAGTRIGCTRGRIWITEDVLPLDIVLEPGESYEVLRSGAVVVQALRESTLAVRNTGQPNPAQRLPARLARLFGLPGYAANLALASTRASRASR